MKSIHTEISIKTDRKTVWQALTNFIEYPSWNPFILEVNGIAELGETLKVKIKPKDQSAMTFKPKVIALDENKELRWLGRVLMPGIFDGEHIFLLEEVSPHETLFIQKENFSGVLSIPIFKKIEASTKIGFAEMNLNLKDFCESQYR